MSKVGGLIAVQVVLLVAVGGWLVVGEFRAMNDSGQATERSYDQMGQSVVSVDSEIGRLFTEESEPSEESEPELVSPPYAEPVWVSIQPMGLSRAGIAEVGIDADGTIPVHDDSISWYRYGASPSDSSGAVILLAHIAYDGAPGEFARLDALNVGDRIEIGMEGGATREFMVRSLDLAEKVDFNGRIEDYVDQRSDGLRLYLITCGGSFDSAARSYSSFHIATAEVI